MPSIASILRKACVANNLGVSGSSTVLLDRLIRAKTGATCTKKVRESPNTKRTPKVKKVKCALKRASPEKKSPTKHVPFKNAGAGRRISAAYYFNEMCDGDIRRCCPQYVLQPDGCTYKLKEIKLVGDSRGNVHARWVLAK